MTKLEELRKLAKEAAPAPWEFYYGEFSGVRNGEEQPRLHLTWDAEHELIAAMRNNIVDLLDIAEAASELCYVFQVSNLIDQQTKDSAMTRIKNALEKLN